MRNPLRPEPALGFFALLLPLPLLALVLYWFGISLLGFIKDPLHYFGAFFSLGGYATALGIKVVWTLARNRRAKGVH